MKKWVLLDKAKTEKKDDIIKILLKNRGLTQKKEIEEFLHPSLDYLTLDNLEISRRESDKAVRRIKKAIKDKESIIVYTDYDADGICGGAIVWETLYQMKAKVMPYVPHREKEGYGLSREGIDFIKKEHQAKLIITVDHGVSAIKTIDYAKENGIETIVIDHHRKPTKLPKAKAIIHTTKLAAGGIAWVFSNYLLDKLEPRKRFSFNKIHNLDLAAMATIADMVPLLGPNRVIVTYGLEQLKKTKRLGLNALIKEVGLKKDKIGTYEVGHILTPRLNAMGRLSYALDSLRLICTRDSQRAEKLAKILTMTNRERQALMEEAIYHALETVKSYYIKTSDYKEKLSKLIFISHESYHEGIIGLVAGKLVEHFGRPAVVISKRKDLSKASARSVSGFNIIEAIRKVSDLLENVGGHPMAAGFTIKTKHLEKFKSKLENLADKEISSEQLTKILKIDCEINFNDISYELYQKIAQLKPFGIGNPQPVFVTRKVIPQNARLVGRERRHLKLLVTSSEVEGVGERIPTAMGINAIAFNLGHLYAKLSPETPIDIAYNIEEDNWSRNSCLQLKLKDIRV